MKNYCIDCLEKEIGKNATRCHSCNNKFRWQNKEYREKVSIKMSENHANVSDENNGRFIDGRCKTQYYCIEKGCNNSVCGKGHRCIKCANIKRIKPKNYCVCGKEISRRAKQCKKCLSEDLSIKLKGKGNPNFGNHKLAGKNNPWYIHGEAKRKYPSEFNNELKERIRKRDNYTCQVSGMTNEEHILTYGYNLVIHHIDYNKENNKPKNLISLSVESHARTGFNRKYWEEYLGEVTQNVGSQMAGV